MIPSLVPGDRLTRVEFERRHNVTPSDNYELIEGVVYMASPVKAKGHSTPVNIIQTWLGNYCADTPGTNAGANGSIRLDIENMPQPDAWLIIEPSHGGQAVYSDDDYIEGAPELIVENANTSAGIDLHDKLRAYRRNSVREYIVWRTFDQQIDAFTFRDGDFHKADLPADGILKSEVFPGLWLDTRATLAHDRAKINATLSQCLATPEHAGFVEKLKRRAGEKKG